MSNYQPRLHRTSGKNIKKARSPGNEVSSLYERIRFI